MRQVAARRALSVAAVVAGVCAAAAGCGQQRAGAAAAAAPADTPARTAVACASPSPSASLAHPLTLSDHDNGRSVCVPLGAAVQVFLHGSSLRWWSPIKSSSGALAARANPRMMLALGVTGGYFVAVHRGVATLTSTRSVCAPRVRPTGPTTSAGVHCGGTPMVYRVTVVVTR